MFERKRSCQLGSTFSITSFEVDLACFASEGIDGSKEYTPIQKVADVVPKFGVEGWLESCKGREADETKNLRCQYQERTRDFWATTVTGLGW